MLSLCLFTFYYIYIKTDVQEEINNKLDENLHSIIFILKLKTFGTSVVKNPVFTFYYIYIKTYLKIIDDYFSRLFTFYYIYIKTPQ